MPAGQSFNISDIHSPACASTKVPFCKIGIYKKWKLPAACPAPSQLLTQKQLILVVLAAFKADTPSLLLTKIHSALTPRHLESPWGEEAFPAHRWPLSPNWDSSWVLLSGEPWQCWGYRNSSALTFYAPLLKGGFISEFTGKGKRQVEGVKIRRGLN